MGRAYDRILKAREARDVGTIHIKVQDLYPSAMEKTVVCNNTYTVAWDLGGEWKAYTTKTMRCIWPDGTYQDVVFTGTTSAMPPCPVPGRIEIGLYAGNIRTSRPAELAALPSALSWGGTPVPPPRKCVCPAYGNAEGRQDQGP